MQKTKYKKYYQQLDLEENCSFEELLRSYNHLKKLYSTECIASIPFEEELSEKDKSDILSEIDKAFDIISQVINKEKKPPILQNSSSGTNNIINSPAFSGAYLQAIRINKNLDLQHLSFITKISVDTLNNIENESFHKLPHSSYLRCQVKTFASYLNLNSNAAASEYMKKYHNWERKIKLTN